MQIQILLNKIFEYLLRKPKDILLWLFFENVKTNFYIKFKYFENQEDNQFFNLPMTSGNQGKKSLTVQNCRKSLRSQVGKSGFKVGNFQHNGYIAMKINLFG